MVMNEFAVKPILNTSKLNSNANKKVIAKTNFIIEEQVFSKDNQNQQLPVTTNENSSVDNKTTKKKESRWKKIIRFFTKRSSDTITQPAEFPPSDTSTTSNSFKGGLLRMTARVVRRKVLNILQRRKNDHWAISVDREQSNEKRKSSTMKATKLSTTNNHKRSQILALDSTLVKSKVNRSLLPSESMSVNKGSRGRRVWQWVKKTWKSLRSTPESEDMRVFKSSRDITRTPNSIKSQQRNHRIQLNSFPMNTNDSPSSAASTNNNNNNKNRRNNDNDNNDNKEKDSLFGKITTAISSIKHWQAINFYSQFFHAGDMLNKEIHDWRTKPPKQQEEQQIQQQQQQQLQQQQQKYEEQPSSIEDIQQNIHANEISMLNSAKSFLIAGKEILGETFEALKTGATLLLEQDELLKDSKVEMVNLSPEINFTDTLKDTLTVEGIPERNEYALENNNIDIDYNNNNNNNIDERIDGMKLNDLKNPQTSTSTLTIVHRGSTTRRKQRSLISRMLPFTSAVVSTLVNRRSGNVEVDEVDRLERESPWDALWYSLPILDLLRGSDRYPYEDEMTSDNHHLQSVSSNTSTSTATSDGRVTTSEESPLSSRELEYNPQDSATFNKLLLKEKEMAGAWISWPVSTLRAVSQRVMPGNPSTSSSNNAVITAVDLNPASATTSSTATFSAATSNNNFNMNTATVFPEVKIDKTRELKKQKFQNLPLATKADFLTLDSKLQEASIYAALNAKTAKDAIDFLRICGKDALMNAVISPSTESLLCSSARINNLLGTPVISYRSAAMKALCRLIRLHPSLAESVGVHPRLIDALAVAIEQPVRGIKTFQSAQDREREYREQYEALALVHRIVRTSDRPVEVMRGHAKLRTLLTNIALLPESATSTTSTSTSTTTLSSSAITPSTATTAGSAGNTVVTSTSSSAASTSFASSAAGSALKKNTTVVAEYVNLRPQQMARVASWALGGVPWRPRQAGQRGVRILSLDGGGTRGVISIAILKELFRQLKRADLQPHDVFDIVCGTSTGGIIAACLAMEKFNITKTEMLYDTFIEKIFAQKSNLKFVTDQVFYDETSFEKILYSIAGDKLMLDSNQQDCPRVFCVSTKMHAIPPEVIIWRNYNYPPETQPKYAGAFRVNTVTAVRATAAAPTFFKAVQWEGGFYCDGGLLANNPTAIALQEAKHLYPDVPVELVVSIGQGLYRNPTMKMQNVGLNLVLNHLVAASTDTEDVHGLLQNFLSDTTYFRFNLDMKNNTNIDETNKDVLNRLKEDAAAQFYREIKGARADRYEKLFKALRGK